jgi:hypothetical protein
MLASARSGPVSSAGSEISHPFAGSSTKQDIYGRSEVKEEEKYQEDTQPSKIVKMSKAAVLGQENEALGLLQKQGERGPTESAGQLPRHLQNMIDAFHAVNVLSARNGPCSLTLKASESEMYHLGRSKTFFHGRTGEPLEAKKYLVRKGRFVLVANGPSLAKSSIIRCLPKETGVQGIAAWAVWKGLEGMERNFLIFKVVGTSFTFGGKRRKELLTLQNHFKAQKRDPFIPAKVKITRKKQAKQAKQHSHPSTSEKGREVDYYDTTDELESSDSRNLSDMQAGHLEDFNKKPGACQSSPRYLVDLTEESHVLASGAIPVGYGKASSTSIHETVAESTNVPSQEADSTASSSPKDPARQLGSSPLFDLLPLRKRENTLFSFINDSDEVSRTRRFGTCDSVGKLFLQAEIGGLVQKADEEAALSLVVSGAKRLVVPNRDDESFRELIEAIASAEIWEGQEVGDCRVEVRAYG